MQQPVINNSKGFASQGFTSKGFTLVELLLAITLFAILMGLVYGGLRAATQATDRGQVVLAESTSMRTAHQFIRRQLSLMMPLSYSEDVSDRIVFEGESGRIQYVAPMPGYLGQGGPQVQVIELAGGDEDGDVLLFSHALLQGFEPFHLDEREPIVLLEGIRDASFEFMGRDSDGELTDWMNTWDEPETIPVAVRLLLEFESEARPPWPILTSAVKIDTLGVNATITTGSYTNTINNLVEGREVD